METIARLEIRLQKLQQRIAELAPNSFGNYPRGKERLMWFINRYESVYKEWWKKTAVLDYNYRPIASSVAVHRLSRSYHKDY